MLASPNLLILLIIAPSQMRAFYHLCKWEVDCRINADNKRLVGLVAGIEKLTDTNEFRKTEKPFGSKHSIIFPTLVLTQTSPQTLLHEQISSPTNVCAHA